MNLGHSLAIRQILMATRRPEPSPDSTQGMTLAELLEEDDPEVGRGLQTEAGAKAERMSPSRDW